MTVKDWTRLEVKARMKVKSVDNKLEEMCCPLETGQGNGV